MSEKKHDFDQHELEKIRMKKMKAIIDAKKRKEAAQERNVSISILSI